MFWGLEGLVQYTGMFWRLEGLDQHAGMFWRLEGLMQHLSPPDPIAFPIFVIIF
jgi:hypothetical protein